MADFVSASLLAVLVLANLWFNDLSSVNVLIDEELAARAFEDC